MPRFFMLFITGFILSLLGLHYKRCNFLAKLGSLWTVCCVPVMPPPLQQRKGGGSIGTAWDGLAFEYTLHPAFTTMAKSKLARILVDGMAITGMAAGIGFFGQNDIKGSMTNGPSSNMMNYVKFNAVIASKWLQKIPRVPERPP